MSDGFDKLLSLVDRLADEPTARSGVVSQGNTRDWREARCGRFTASNFHQLVSKGGNFNEKGMSYIISRATERITGVSPAPSGMTDAMSRGIDLEPEAIEWLAAKWTDTICRSSWRIHPVRTNLGSTPDFEVFEGQIPGDIKCPSSPAEYVWFATLDHDESGTALKAWNPRYYWQIMVQAYTSNRDYAALAYYYPELQEQFRHTVRIYRLTSLAKQIIEDTADSAEIAVIGVMERMMNSKRIA